MDSSTELPRQPAAHRLAAVFGILVLIFCFVYFFELASFPFSLDEEWAAFRKDPSIWIAQGRWGAFLIEKYILSQPSIPFVPQMMFGFACAAAFLMILRMLGRDILALSLQDYASFVVFCAFPTWFFIVEFSANIGSVGIGLLSGTIAVYIASGQVKDWRASRTLLALLLASVLGAFAIATYQTLLFYIFCVCVGLFLVKSTRNDKFIDVNLVLSFAAVTIGSAIFYYFISIIFKYIYNVTETYTNIFFNTGYFFSNPAQALLKTIHEAAGYYGASEVVYRSPVWALPVMLATGLLALLFDGKHSSVSRLVLVAAAGAMLAAPFTLNPFFPAFVLGRTMVATAVAAWFACYLGLHSRTYAIRFLATAALVLVVAQIVIVQNKNQASSYFLAKHDLLVATSIYDRLGNSPGFRKGVSYPMAVFGGRRFQGAYSASATSNAGASFFGPFVGNNQRIRNYLKLLSLEGLRPVTDAELDTVVVRLSQMPIWPAAGSVVLVDGKLLVRLGRVPGPAEADSLKRMGAAAPE